MRSDTNLNPPAVNVPSTLVQPITIYYLIEFNSPFGSQGHEPGNYFFACMFSEVAWHSEHSSLALEVISVFVRFSNET